MKIFKKLKKKLNNEGSSIIMVIASVSFIAILVAALLSAASYAYRLKLQDLNARDNFYYVEQAMNEIYAGVGSQVVSDMQEAYTYTVENMVEYKLDSMTYETIDDQEANKKFKDRFMLNLSNNDYFSDDSDIVTEIASYISNDTVLLDPDKISVSKEYKTDENGISSLSSIIIKNVTLTRTVDYNRSSANGSYTQTLSTDIVISEPDFNVIFNSTDSKYANIFKYALVADMGIEIAQKATPLSISGNIYGAADYYNKDYDTSGTGNNVTQSYIVDGESVEVNYDHSSVTSKNYVAGDGEIVTAYNSNNAAVSVDTRDYYDGENTDSMYSGLLISDGTDVSILADNIIIPGTISILDSSTLSIFGKSGLKLSEADVWTDNVVLGGSSIVNSTEGADGTTVSYTGSTASIRATLHVKDDTEINANGANFKLVGSYYGYGDSTSRDARVYAPTVDLENFVVTNEDSTTTNRGHYNSSAIIVNGELSTLDLGSVSTLYLAGRSYIEMSKIVDEVEGSTTVEGSTDTVSTTTQTYQYNPTASNLLTSDADDTVYARDYKTGESVSVKSNQFAYVPITSSGVPVAVFGADGSLLYYEATLAPSVNGNGVFEEYFPDIVFGGKVPCVLQEVSGKKYYFYDFQTAYDRCSTTTGYSATFVAEFPTVDDYTRGFITAYVAELNDADSAIADSMVDITNYEDFELASGRGEGLILPSDSTSIYSSGAITSKVGTSFTMKTATGNGVVDSLLSNYGQTTSYATAALASNALSDTFDKEYSYVKWNLGQMEGTDIERKYVDEVCNTLGESYITPINKFMNFSAITSDVSIRPKSSSDGVSLPSNVLNLTSGYKVWVSYDDVTVSADSSGTVSGIVVSKGDVFFDDSVTRFEGMVVCGGKIYITNNLTDCNASAEVCRCILRECQLNSDDNSKLVLSIFKGYEDSAIGSSEEDEDAKTIDTIDYSDVVTVSNWMKNVE